MTIAHDQWRSNVFSAPVCWDLELTAHFDEVSRHVRPEDMHAGVLISSDPSSVKIAAHGYHWFGVEPAP